MRLLLSFLPQKVQRAGEREREHTPRSQCHRAHTHGLLHVGVHSSSSHYFSVRALCVRACVRVLLLLQVNTGWTNRAHHITQRLDAWFNLEKDWYVHTPRGGSHSHRERVPAPHSVCVHSLRTLSMPPSDTPLLLCHTMCVCCCCRFEAPFISCLDVCADSADGDCDDGGPGSEYDGCVLGTDCTDCGTREEPTTATGSSRRQLSEFTTTSSRRQLSPSSVESWQGMWEELTAATATSSSRQLSESSVESWQALNDRQQVDDQVTILYQGGVSLFSSATVAKMVQVESAFLSLPTYTDHCHMVPPERGSHTHTMPTA